MKDITQKINESKTKTISVVVNLDKFSNDVYNVLGELLFEYNQAGKNIRKAEAKEALDDFIMRFYE